MTPVTPVHGTPAPTGLRPLRRAAAGVVLALVAALAVSLAPTSPAEATISRLCYGFADCKEKGYGNYRYKANIGTMWWRMYSGHNCTNYAAYRMVKSGMSTSRPWSGSGNASNWGYAMDRITDGTPAVGAVAWWKAYAPGAGSSGHVAVVEEVVSRDKIIVSQDSWGGDFSWAVITRSGSGWPSGFIHFNDRAMKNVAAPTVAGEARVGEILTTDGGSWSPRGVELAYQWQVGRRGVPGATDPTYTLRREDQGKRVRVKVVASQGGFDDIKVHSARTAAVAPGTLASTAEPTITGTPAIGQPLTATPGTWNLPPDRVRYQWLAAGEPVPGATGATFVPGQAQLEKRIRVQVTAVKEGYDDVTVLSAWTRGVTPGALVPSTAPSIAGTPAPGQQLALDPGATTPAPTGTSIQWLRDGAPVAGATAATYDVTADDLGSALSATVVHTRSGYESLEAQAPATAPVRSPAALQPRARSRRDGTVRVRGAVTAPDVAPVTGKVVVKFRRQALARVPLAEGGFDTVVDGLRRGERGLKVVYRGSDVTTQARARLVVTVR